MPAPSVVLLFCWSLTRAQVVAFRLERHLALLEHLFDFMALHTAYFHHGYHSLKASEADIRLLREVTGFPVSACVGVSSRNAPSVGT
jgi:hypothetical protein